MHECIRKNRLRVESNRVSNNGKRNRIYCAKRFLFFEKSFMLSLKVFQKSIVLCNSSENVIQFDCNICLTIFEEIILK